MTLYGIWRTLGVARTSDVAAIRSAYAVALKAMDVDADPAGFTTLRAARDQALAMARRAAEAEVEVEIEDEDEDEVADERSAELPFSEHIFIPLGDRLRITPPDARVSGRADLELTTTQAPVADGYRLRPAAAPETADERSLPSLKGATLAPPTLEHSADAGTVALNSLSDDPAARRDVHSRAVLGILFPDEPDAAPMDDATDRALLDHVAVLLDDPEMEEIAFHTDAEAWFARVLAASLPRADAAVPMVAEHFGWLADRGRIDQSGNVAAVVARYDTLAFYRAVRMPGHRYFRAWRELTAPADERSRRGSVGANEVEQLLAIVRRDHPALEECFDWYRVSIWEPSPSGAATSSSGNGGSGGWGWAIAAIWLLFVLFRGVAGDHGNGGTPTSDSRPQFVVSNKLVSAEKDLGAVLGALSGDALSLEDVRQGNLKLYTMLVTNWRLAKEDDRARDGFLRDTAQQLMDRYNAGQRRAPYPIAAASRQLDIDKAKALSLRRGAAACDDFFSKGKASDGALPTDIVARDRALFARTLLETDGDPPRRPGSGRFAVKGSVLDEAARRAGLKPKELVAALNVGGTPKTRCAARIALIETALALPPREGLTLLHDM